MSEALKYSAGYTLTTKGDYVILWWSEDDCFFHTFSNAADDHIEASDAPFRYAQPPHDAQDYRSDDGVYTAKYGFPGAKLVSAARTARDVGERLGIMTAVYDYEHNKFATPNYPHTKKSQGIGCVSETDTFPAPTRKESSMNLSQPLTVPKSAITEGIQKKLDADKAAFDADQAKAQADQQENNQFAQAVAAARPDVVYSLLSNPYYLGDFKTVEDFIAYLDKRQPNPAQATYTPDQTASKLLSVLNSATDETLQVESNDDLIKYL